MNENTTKTVEKAIRKLKNGFELGTHYIYHPATGRLGPIGFLAHVAGMTLREIKNPMNTVHIEDFVANIYQISYPTQPKFAKEVTVKRSNRRAAAFATILSKRYKVEV